MKKKTLGVLFFAALFAKEESFITIEEYGKELYKNPRGIGCIHCHGSDGRGGVIASYKHKNIPKILKAPDITVLDFETFKKRTLMDKGVMPKYHLTDTELQAIFAFLHSNLNP
ncbi:c-type cytochrome [Helicobacter mustelae]|uniref:Putative periplasmic protein n=1 Tax=Helicobacter mustelae (strain ATCC 43772 / CCUG 25715 / CIP 103759 / LMG 18044 / NCTC 12198 / R85-136P) TaxID=679897 RepID=D3UHD0_HELM1|nr:cytochrome c [Helicobacter mustelae]CBG39902.1 putative periplasmic protein [Helicobacter mustelae 12198]SQH71413.1 Putative periplasmic protein [Helicobacter mustelae]STP12541.1 Putative periplasmic protein [Helicobacter mustelae]